MTARWTQDVPVEEWRSIPGLPGYRVSSLGRILSTRPYQGSTEPRILKGSHNGRYRVVVFCCGNDRTTRYVHHVVAEVFHGPRPEGCSDVRHMDGDRSNNAASNLRYGTRSENILDAVRHGTHPQSSQTHCLRGHAFNEANTYWRKDGHRRCRACARVRYAEQAVAA